MDGQGNLEQQHYIGNPWAWFWGLCKIQEISKGSGTPVEITISAPYEDYRYQKLEIMFKSLGEMFMWLHGLVRGMNAQ